MNDTAIIDTSRLRGSRRVKSRPKGRQVDPAALADVRALLGDAPRERSLLIEHLHRIQDARGYLPAAHLVALAHEMKLAMTEVYEVATFYHHFDVVDAGETPPPEVSTAGPRFRMPIVAYFGLFLAIFSGYLLSTSRERPWGDATPIFQVADYGLVARWEDAIPALTEEIRKLKASRT